MFTMIEHVNYGGDINHGHAKVAMNTGSHACIIDCIYEVDDEWHFMYENNHCLSYEEIAKFERFSFFCTKKCRFYKYVILHMKIFFIRRTIMDMDYENKMKALRKISIAVLVGVLLLITICNSFCVIPTGYTGVRVTFGQIDNVVVPNGINFKIPFVQSIKKVNNKQQDAVFDDIISSETLERNEVYFDGITVTYQISAEKSAWIFANISDYKNSLVNSSLVASAIKSCSKRLSPTDVTNRATLEPLVKDELQKSLNEKYGSGVVTVNKVIVNNATFDDAYNDKLAKKQQAQMAYETQQIENKTSVEKAEADAKAQLAKAQADADASIIAANADAEVAKISADSAEYQGQKDAAIMSNLGEMLTKYPQLIDYYKVTGWDGKLPEVQVGADSDSSIILNTPTEN